MGMSDQSTQDKGIVELAKESAGHDHSFGKKQIFQIVGGLGLGIVGWNMAQKNESIRKVFNFPAELVTNAIHKTVGGDRDAISLGVREIYDVFVFGPIIALFASLTNKFMGQSPGTPQ